MKAKFFTTTFLLLFARGCDFYSTSLFFFQPNGMSSETNPLTRFFGVGWNGLIIANLILVGLGIYAYYFYMFKHVVQRPRVVPEKLTEYVSQIYYNQTGKFFGMFYLWPKNPKVALAHTGYVFVHVAIFGSLLATVHNLGQFYQVPIYGAFRELVGRPQFVIYGLFVFSALYFQFKVWQQEFDMAKAGTGF